MIWERPQQRQTIGFYRKRQKKSEKGKRAKLSPVSFGIKRFFSLALIYFFFLLPPFAAFSPVSFHLYHALNFGTLDNPVQVVLELSTLPNGTAQIR